MGPRPEQRLPLTHGHSPPLISTSPLAPCWLERLWIVMMMMALRVLDWDMMEHISNLKFQAKFCGCLPLTLKKWGA